MFIFFTIWIWIICIDYAIFRIVKWCFYIFSYINFVMLNILKNIHILVVLQNTKVPVLYNFDAVAINNKNPHAC